MLNIKGRIARLLFPYGAERTVLRGPARGTRFTVEPGIGAMYVLGAEDAAPSHFAAWVRPGMTVYDVGANKGQMTLIFSSLVGDTGRVVAFEPAPAEFASLQRNADLNQLGDRVLLVNAAVADSDGELRFTYEAERPTQGKLADVEPTYMNTGAVEFTVPALTLDTFVASDGPPDVIKLDVEGAAAAVLRGASRLLEEHGPSIYLELHGPEELAGVRDELLTRGYVAETLEGKQIDDLTSRWHSPLWCHRGPKA